MHWEKWTMAGSARNAPEGTVLYMRDDLSGHRYPTDGPFLAVCGSQFRILWGRVVDPRGAWDSGTVVNATTLDEAYAVADVILRLQGTPCSS